MLLIGDHRVGPGQPTFIVCELSCNHLGSLHLAHRLIDAAAEAGVDAIKLQTYDPERLAARRGGGRAPAPWSDRSLHKLYEHAQTPRAWHEELFQHAKDVNLIGFASAFDPDDVAFLDALDVPAIKVSAFESGCRDILEAAARTKRPAIVSMPHDAPAWRSELVTSVLPHAALLHCVSKYPTPCKDMGLRFGLARLPAIVRGLSDHTACPQTAPLAVALGAHIIEAHLMLSPGDYGATNLPLDHLHSYTPAEFTSMVTTVRHAEATL